MPGELVPVDRVAECPVQLECRVVSIRELTEPDTAAVEVRVLRVHEALAEPDLRHVRVPAWEPLFHVFRHYVGRGPELGRTFRASTSAVSV